MTKGMKAPRRLSWTPISTRSGGYCSPGCRQQAGGGCTRAEYNKARRDGAALAKRLGKGWKRRVWENIGWHYQADSPCGRLKVHPDIWKGKVDTYTAFLGEPDGIGGRWVEHGKTPRAAIRAVLKVAKAELALIGAVLEGL